MISYTLCWNKTKGNALFIYRCRNRRVAVDLQHHLDGLSKKLSPDNWVCMHGPEGYIRKTLAYTDNNYPKIDNVALLYFLQNKEPLVDEVSNVKLQGEEYVFSVIPK